MNIERRDKIQELQSCLEKLPQIDCPVEHRFAPGCYIREIFMPKGSLVVGKIHLTEHFNVILKGKVTVATVDGVETHEAPYTFVSPAGIQKVVYMHDDCIWQTVHPTDKTDPDEIEAEIITENYDMLECNELIKKIGGES